MVSADQGAKVKSEWKNNERFRSKNGARRRKRDVL